MTPVAHAPQAHVPAVRPTPSRGRLWTGRVLTGWAALFLLVDAVGKLLQAAPYVEGTVALGFPATSVFTVGLLEALCLALSVWGPTAVPGTVLLTGYLGGAVAAHVRLDHALFTHTLSSVYVAAMMWGGLCLRQPRVLALLLPPRAP